MSRASALQRQGRAGRTGPGVSYRMYSEDDFNRLAPYSPPAIQNCQLEGVILQMLSLGMGDPRTAPLPEPPPIASIEVSEAVTALTMEL